MQMNSSSFICMIPSLPCLEEDFPYLFTRSFLKQFPGSQAAFGTTLLESLESQTAIEKQEQAP
jgi:hypothetical protein